MKISKLVISISLIFLAFVGCSSVEKRTKWTDKGKRVLIDPASLSSGDYVAVQTALVKDGAFTVVDRGQAYKAIKGEQERTLRKEEDRFADKEKWSQWGKLYGVGSIVVGHTQCYRAKPFFSRYTTVNRCKQFLSLVDSNTGEVIVAVEGEDEKPMSVEAGSFNEPADWAETVSKLVEAYPKDYKPQYYSEKLENYRDVSAEEAKRQREISSEGNK